MIAKLHGFRVQNPDHIFHVFGEETVARFAVPEFFLDFFSLADVGARANESAHITLVVKNDTLSSRYPTDLPVRANDPKFNRSVGFVVNRLRQ